MKISSDTIGNRTRDLRTYSAVPQPTAPPGVQYTHYTFLKFDHVISHNHAVRDAIIDFRNFTVGNGLSQWADISVFFRISLQNFHL